MRQAGALAPEPIDPMLGIDQVDMFDPDDAYAPVAEDLIASSYLGELPMVWPENDLAAAQVITHADEPDAFEAADLPRAALQDERLEAAPAAPERFAEPPPAPSASSTQVSTGGSVFRDLFAPIDRSAPSDFEGATQPAGVAAADEATAGVATELAPVASDAVDWPPVPTNFFPPLPHDLPTLNLDVPPSGELEISWPQEPRPQTFWPQDPIQGSVAEESDDDGSGWMPMPPSFNDDELVEYASRFVSPPSRSPEPALAPPAAGDHPMLVFSDPPPTPTHAEIEELRESALSRFASHASALADRIPDRWSLTTAPKLASTSEDAVARDLAEIQSPALTVLFAVVVIGAVLLFISIVSPLLR